MVFIFWQNRGNPVTQSQGPKPFTGTAAGCSILPTGLLYFHSPLDGFCTAYFLCSLTYVAFFKIKSTPAGYRRSFLF